MILSFPVPSTPFPIGGVAAIYDYACAMAARGHTVHLYHHEIFRQAVESVADIDWYDFADGVEHHFPGVGRLDVTKVPSADVTFGYSPELEQSPRLGLPVVLIQGYGMLGDDVERYAYESPCPKICVARWLVDVGLEMGVPQRQLMHVPLGLHHARFPLTTPIEERPPQVSFLNSSHEQKRSALAIEALAEVRRDIPDLRVVAFGALESKIDVPSWVSFHTNPPREVLIEEIYNRSRGFVCSSYVEGFGLPSVEAMSCGAALVTTDNGGSRDYAIHGETALVSPPDDLGALITNLKAILTDDELRVRIATGGNEFVKRFDWGRSAAMLETILEEYVADPDSFRSGGSTTAEYQERFHRPWATWEP